MGQDVRRKGGPWSPCRRHRVTCGGLARLSLCRPANLLLPLFAIELRAQDETIILRSAYWKGFYWMGLHCVLFLGRGAARSMGQLGNVCGELTPWV